MEYRKYLKNIPVTKESDQRKGLPIPDIEKPVPEGANLIDLVPPSEFTVGKVHLIDAIKNRVSHRKFTEEKLTLEELSFLLWSTQGVKELVRDGHVTLRTVPSGGGMHPFETYLVINHVEGLENGVYRYIATQHKLLLITTDDVDKYPKMMTELSHKQSFVGKSAVVFIWTARPYRTEWRYGEDSLKDICMSVGHICQNLYLACEGIPNTGTCAILAYQQDGLDKFLKIDGYNEVTLYLSPVGKLEK
ncbi:MAG: SagB/ThcOx family dehydrogenase [Candidatus Heimdallarchaeota archaeon]